MLPGCMDPLFMALGQRHLHHSNMIQVGLSKYMVIDLRSKAAVEPLVRIPDGFSDVLRPQQALNEGSQQHRSEIFAIGVLL